MPLLSTRQRSCLGLFRLTTQIRAFGVRLMSQIRGMGVFVTQSRVKSLVGLALLDILLFSWALRAVYLLRSARCTDRSASAHVFSMACHVMLHERQVSARL